MSVNVYLKETVREVEGFVTEPYKDGSGDNMRLNGMYLFTDKGRLHFTLNNDGSVPQNLEGFVEDVSLHEEISAERSRRETGIYRHGNAEAELEIGRYSRGRNYSVQIRGKKLEDVQTLLRMIKAGTIRPELSYEGPQGGLSRAELEAELEQVRTELKRAQTKAELMESGWRRATDNPAEILTARLRVFCGKLEKGWPFSRNTTVANRIKAILSDTK